MHYPKFCVAILFIINWITACTASDTHPASNVSLAQVLSSTYHFSSQLFFPAALDIRPALNSNLADIHPLYQQPTTSRPNHSYLQKYQNVMEQFFLASYYCSGQNLRFLNKDLVLHFERPF